MSMSPTVPDFDEAVKFRFAEAFLRTGNASTAGIEVLPEMGLALKAAKYLPHDAVVLAEIARLKEEVGEEGFLPGKAQIAREIYDRAKVCLDPEGYERLMKLYANIRDFIPKPGMNVNVDARTQNVMVIKDLGSDEEWASKAARQQQGLIIDSVN